jgi:hypothetical protein
MVLDWAHDHLTDGDRQRLARGAADEIEALFAEWAGLERAGDGALGKEDLELYALVGFAPPSSFVAEAEWALRQRVIAPLARHGIIVDTSFVGPQAERALARQPTKPTRTANRTSS